MKYLCIFILGLAVISCDSTPTEPVVDPVALEKIAKLYGCKVSPRVKAAPTPVEGKITYIELTLSEGKALGVTSEEQVSSNASFIVYHSLSPEERKKHTHIRCLIKEEKTTGQFDYPLDQLQAVEQLLPQVEQIEELLLLSRYEEITTQMTDFAQEKLGESLIATLQAQEEERGKVTEIKSLGFKTGQSKRDGEMLKAVSWLFMVKRTTKNTYLEIVLPLSDTTAADKVLGIRVP